MNMKLHFLVSCFSLVSCSHIKDNIVVNTTSGPIIGHPVTSVDKRTNTTIHYTTFPTIPFAKPPVGDLRFRAPQPLEAGEIINTTGIAYERVCYQLGDWWSIVPDSPVEADEDCLYLHVHVPGVWPPEEPLPVMIWFTGGAFVFGAGAMYGPDYWMGEDIIVVTVNYRLGPFGFLSLGLEEAAGNQGMLDQRLAMVWVQDNIASLGGDPDRVTIAGESAGSFSLGYHLVSPGSRGLFRFDKECRVPQHNY